MYYWCSITFLLLHALLAWIPTLHLNLISYIFTTRHISQHIHIHKLFLFWSYYNYTSHSRYYIWMLYIKMLKIHSEGTCPAEEHAISSPQHLKCCSFPNTSMTPNCLFIIEITGDFSRIKWQMIKFSLWLRGGRRDTTMAPLTLHCPLLATPAPCRLITSSWGETSGIQNKPLTKTTTQE